MAKYRLFCASPTTGHMSPFVEFTARSDVEAINRAEALRDGRTAELWSTYRVVRTFRGQRDFMPGRPAAR